MPSANGFCLEVSQAGKAFNLVASWAAPYYVVPAFFVENGEEPALIHCENLAHAQMHSSIGGAIFNAKFEQVAA